MMPKLRTKMFGNIMAQSLNAINMWEDVLSRIDFKRIVEIGTYKGNLSLYFALYCQERYSEFRTYDLRHWIKFERHSSHLKERFLEPHRFVGDVFKQHMHQEIGRFIKRKGISIVFCDGGDKKLELGLFSRYLKKGDIIAVHDWGTEVKPEDIEETIKTYNLEHAFVEQSEKEGHTRFFRKK